MKKNISVFYRLAFILFSVWAILENVGFKIVNLPGSLLNFTVLADLICMICILFVLMFSFQKKIGQGLYTVKTACTFLALLALAANLQVFTHIMHTAWILKILLPLLMILDHIIFDDNKKLKIWQMLLWLLAAMFVAFMLYVLTDKFLNIANSLGLLGLFNNPRELMQLLLNALLLSLITYLLDKLFSGELFHDIRSMFALFFRLIFVILEIWAFSKLSGMDLKVFLHAIRYYENLINFLCFLCITAVLVYNTFKHKSNAKSAYVFTKIKAFFTVSMVLVFLLYHFFLRGGTKPDAVSVILYYVAPAMMLIDWIFIETKSDIRGQEPLIWTALTVGYFVIVFLLSMFGVAILYPMFAYTFISYVGLIAAVMLIAGYLFYLIDRFIKRR